MSSFYEIEDVREKTNNGTLNASVLHQIEKKCIRTIGNIISNGAPITTAATSSSTKISVTSTAEGKSVVSSISMSMERKDSVQYMPSKIPPCIIPAGQSTVIHLDNYTHFMAQRVTTTKTAFKRAEIISERNKPIIVPCPTTSANNSSSGVGAVDVDLKVILGGVNSSHHNNNKTLDMNKQKLLGSKVVKPSKLRGRKNFLALDYKKTKKVNEMIDLKTDKPDTSTAIKRNTTKKTKINRRKKVIKPRQSRRSKIKAITGAVLNEDKDEKEVEKLHALSYADSKFLRPCVYTLQSRKCLSEMTCPYLHSDFPCKYYYLNLLCPQGFKCQFMHNGPLEPKLIEALRKHILDLLSIKPSAVEAHFIQQMYNIEDLTQRLQSFRNHEGANNEVIEVLDDEEEEQEYVKNRNSIDVNTNNLNDKTTIGSLSHALHEAVISPMLQPTADKLDMVYENFKETNSIIDEVDKKLKNLKTTSNMTPNEKIHELQNIYDTLKEQEKILPIYENLNTVTTTTAQLTATYDNNKNTSFAVSLSNVQNEQPHIVLVNPDIVNDIQTSVCQENGITLTDDENNMTLAEHNDCLESQTSNVIPEVDTEFQTIEEIPQEDGIELITIEKLPQHDSSDSNEATSSSFKDSEINDLNMTYEEEETATDIETFSNNSNLTVQESHENTEQNNEQQITKTNAFETIPFESKQFEYNSLQTSAESLDSNNSLEFNNNERMDEWMELNKSLTQHNETLQLDITNGEKELIENNVNDIANKEDIEYQSPPYEDIAIRKPAKRDRIRLRSHTLHDTEENTTNIDSEKVTATTLEPTKPIKTRRLRLPKPIHKTTEKTNIDECQINADVINKLIKSTEDCESLENKNKETTCLQDVAVPLTQNILLPKRYFKTAKAKLEEHSLVHETEVIACNRDIDANVEENMLALHSGNTKNLNAIANIYVSLPTEISNDNTLLNSSHNPLTAESDGDNVDNIYNDISTSSANFDIIKPPNKDKIKSVAMGTLDIEKSNTLKYSNSIRRISFENPTSSFVSLPSTSIKEQFNLGNPHVVLTKLKTPFVMPSTQKDVQADSTTSYVNPIVTSTSLAGDKSTQKRRNFTAEYDLDTSIKENKCLKIDHFKSIRKVKIDRRKRTHSQQSIDSKDDNDFDTDSSDEKLTIADALQTSSCSSNEEPDFFEPSSTHVATQHNHYSHQHKHKEQETESDLRQQIESVSNKSDLQLQTIQQQRYQAEDEAERTSTDASFLTENSNNLTHKQYQQQEKILVLEQKNKKVEEEEDEEEVVHNKNSDENKKEKEQIANAYNSHDRIKKDEDGRTQSLCFKRIYEPEENTSTSSSNKYSNETSVTEKEVNVEYSTYSSLYNKLSSHATKCQINCENSAVNITPISSPTYGDNTIASPSPIRKSIDFRADGEVDGRLTYPPIPYILYEIDFGNIDVNKPLWIDKLKKTIQLDPRIFRTQVKKQIMPFCKPVEMTSNALVPLKTSNTLNYSHDPALFAQPTTSMVPSWDPRSRTPALMADIATPSLSHQTALTPYNNSLQTVGNTSPSSSFMHTGTPNAFPLALQYHSTSQPIIQPQQQQTPNMFLYARLQRSSWYQSLMSTVKIQINQSISQLVRALNNFHRERLLNPEIVFDVFKIDCAGELLEIMHNLGVYVDANGIINEQRHVPAFGGRSCCGALPVNATYSFIQQVLTPNTHCTSLTTASSTYNAGGGTPVDQLNVNEPFVSCYIKAPEPVQKPSHDTVTTQNLLQDDNNNNRNYNNNRNEYNNNNNSNNNYNNQHDNRRFGNQFRKPYDKNNGNNNYQQRSNPRYNNYNNNPRFMKPGSSSPSKSNSSPPNSPRNSDGGNNGSYGGGRGRGGGGRFNNNRRFNNYNNNNDKSNGTISWPSTSDSNENGYNKYQNNSPPRNTSPNSSYQTGSPKTSSPPPPQKSSNKDSNDEECWDSDN